MATICHLLPDSPWTACWRLALKLANGDSVVQDCKCVPPKLSHDHGDAMILVSLRTSYKTTFSVP